LPWASNPGDNPWMDNKKYNGKEFVEMHGYNISDLGFRGYQHSIMRFTGVDVLAETTPGISPYAFCYNNPVRYIDPLGLAGEDIINDNSLDLWGRNKYNSSTGMYIPPYLRPSITNFGNAMVGHWERVEKFGYYTYSQVDHESSAGRSTVTVGYSIYSNAFIWDSQEEKQYGRPKTFSDLFYAANSITGTIGSATGLLKYQLIQEYKAGASVDEIFEAAKQLKKISKPVALIGKALGIVSIVQHGSKVIDALNQEKKDWKSFAINVGKLGLDVVFLVGKSVNPVFLTASVAYGVVDYITEEY